MPKFTRYANLSREDRSEIVKVFRFNRTWSSDAGHAVSCTAADYFHLTTRQWNSKIGADAFAATLAVLVMEKAISIADETEKKE